MNRILIVKTTSMGDVIHALPVLSDLRRAFPGAQIDWMVEEPFADLVRLHHGVGEVVPVALRTWRKKGVAELWRQWKRLRAQLAPKPYDAVIDLQGLMKSALLAKAASGPRLGPGFRHAREPLAACFYSKTASWNASSHAVERLREITASLLDYPLSGDPDFGIQTVAAQSSALNEPKHAWFFHGTARAEKSWSVENWRLLATKLTSDGFRISLPWGTDAERKQAETIAAHIDDVTVLPKMNLGTLALRLQSADLVVGVDTGLVHLSGAMQLPLVALFFATPQWRYAPKFNPNAISLGDMGDIPSCDEVYEATQQLVKRPV
ncbi:MAG: lipopolysaccharide heptosyltransferase I [Burkholderiales bacterium]|nr:lipopolysaccharide heptosyltransferase I [Burkholderiales bacterium]